MKMSSVFMALTVVALIATAPAYAWTNAKSTMGFERCGTGRGVNSYCNLDFKVLDRNGNGELTLSEFRKEKLPASLFRKIDTNHDGVISQSEMDAYNNAHPGGTR